MSGVSTADLDLAPHGRARGSAGYRRVTVALGAVGVTTFALLYFPQGAIPTIGRDLHASPADAALTVSGATLGLAVAVLAWSRIADRIGRARAMRTAVVAAVLVGVLVPFAPTIETLVALRVLQGVALGGAPALALTYLAEHVDRRDALTAAGTYVSGTVLGGVAGRLIAAPLADLAGWRTAALALTAVSVLGAVCVVVALPRTDDAPVAGRDPLWRGVAANLTDPAVLVLYAQGFLLMGAYVAVYNLLGYRLEREPFGLSPTVTSVIFLAGLCGAVSARGAGRLASRYGRRSVLMASAATMAAGAALTLPDRLPLILLGLLVFTTAFFAAHTVASGAVAPTATTGTAQATALYTLFYYTGSSLFGWLGGVAFGHGWTGTATMVVAIVGAAFGCAALSGPRTPQGR